MMRPNKSLLGAALLAAVLLGGCSGQAAVSAASAAAKAVPIPTLSATAIPTAAPVAQPFAFSDCVCGLVDRGEGADLLAADLVTGECRQLAYLEGIDETQQCAVNNTGTKIAYTSLCPEPWADRPMRWTVGMQLTVRDLEQDTEKSFFVPDEGQQLQAIQWVPNTNQLLLVIAHQNSVFFSYSLELLDVETGQQTVLDTGDLYEALSEQEARDLMARYGDTVDIPLDEESGWYYAEIHDPQVSNDGKNVLYTVSFYRDATPAYRSTDPVPHLWLASGVWVCPLDGSSAPQCLWKNADPERDTGKAIWGEEGKTLYICRARDGSSPGGSSIDALELESGQLTPLVKVDQVHDTNIVQAYQNGTLWYVTRSQSGAERSMQLDVQTPGASAAQLTVRYQGELLLIGRFGDIAG